jgi:hypothetical protein
MVKEEGAGGWVMGIFYWEAWDGADGLPGPRGAVVVATHRLLA